MPATVASSRNVVGLLTAMAATVALDSTTNAGLAISAAIRLRQTPMAS